MGASASSQSGGHGLILFPGSVLRGSAPGNKVCEERARVQARSPGLLGAVCRSPPAKVQLARGEAAAGSRVPPSGLFRVTQRLLLLANLAAPDDARPRRVDRALRKTEILCRHKLQTWHQTSGRLRDNRDSGNFLWLERKGPAPRKDCSKHTGTRHQDHSREGGPRIPVGYTCLRGALLGQAHPPSPSALSIPPRVSDRPPNRTAGIVSFRLQVWKLRLREHLTKCTPLTGQSRDPTQDLPGSEKHAFPIKLVLRIPLV